ncbi:MAG TPA: hypothetical protein VE592_09460 [Geminicoccaceae bacterium]|nr:hypothetical protein [Geminicoccaceae bacterium]
MPRTSTLRLGKPRKWVADLAHQSAGVALDPKRILAQQVRRAGLVEVGHRGLGVAEGLAETDEARIGVQLDPDQIAVLGHLNGLDRGDLHLASDAFHAVPGSLGARSRSGQANVKRVVADGKTARPARTEQ